MKFRITVPEALAVVYASAGLTMSFIQILTS